MGALGVAPALVVCVAAIIGALAVVLAAIVLRSGSRRLTTVPPVVKCLVSGLLAGLGLIVMLPSALEERPPGWTFERLLLVFSAAPLFMFFVHHVLLDHQHGDDEHAQCSDDACPDQTCLACDKHGGGISIGFRPSFCPPVGTPLPGPKASDDSAPRGELQAACAQLLTTLLRALPYTVHATLDGAVLSTATSVKMLLSLALPISLCTVQDVGVILGSQAARAVPSRATLAITALFGVGFPLGAGLALAATAASTGAASGPTSVEAALSPLRAFAGGVFLYLATFEIAPPHAHGRLPSLRYLLAFALGFGLVYLSEAMEDLGVSAAMGGGATRPNMTADNWTGAAWLPGGGLAGPAAGGEVWARAPAADSAAVPARGVSAALLPTG